MENLNNTPENLNDYDLSLSKLNKYMNKKYTDCVASKPFLLSSEKAREIKKTISKGLLPDVLKTGNFWWLHPTGFVSYLDGFIPCVDSDGVIINDGYIPCLDYGVRPAFNIENSEDLNLKLGDKIKVADISCTVVMIEDNEATALCDNVLFDCEFDKDYRKCVNYENSNLKQELENYFKDKELKVEVVKSQGLDEILSYTKPQPADSNSSKEIPDER